MSTYRLDQPWNDEWLHGEMDGKPGLYIAAPMPIGIRSLHEGDLLIFADRTGDVVDDDVKWRGSQGGSNVDVEALARRIIELAEVLEINSRATKMRSDELAKIAAELRGNHG